jgi:hypothetical protein
MSAWRPIETAPDSSKTVLLFGDGPAILACVYVGGWDELNQHWRLIGAGICFPTHWMPLPKPPKD